MAVGTVYRYFADKDALLVACADDVGVDHRRAVADVLASPADPADKLRRYITGRYRVCREIGTGSKHAAELARAVVALHPERLADEARLMTETVSAILTEAVAGGTFGVADVGRDAEVFLLAVSSFFPNASMGLAAWPPEAQLVRVIDWFIDAWRQGRRATEPKANP